MKKDLIQTLKIITLSLMLSAGFALAWTAPTSSPTANDATPPINVSGIVQLKDGALATGPLLVSGPTTIHGNVSILGDTSTPPTGGGSRTAMKFLNNIFASFLNTAFAVGNQPTTPTLTEVTPVGVNGVTSDSTPNYTFNSNVAGTISFTGGCTSSTSSVPYGNTTVTLNHLYNGVYSCTVQLTTTDGTLSNLLYFDFEIQNNPSPTPTPLPTSDLYVSGRVGVGVPVPTEKLDVSGNVKIASLQNTAVKLVRICADQFGKIILCPSGSSSSMGGTLFPSYNMTNGDGTWTVPDGVFRIHVKVSGAGGGGGGAYDHSGGAAGGGGGGGGFSEGDLNVVPGETYFYHVGKGGASGTTINSTAPGQNGGNGESSNFDYFFSASGGAGGKASYHLGGGGGGGITIPGVGGVFGTGTNANGTSGGTGGYNINQAGSGGNSGGSGIGGSGGNGEGPHCTSYSGCDSANPGANGGIVITWNNLIN